MGQDIYGQIRAQRPGDVPYLGLDGAWSVDGHPIRVNSNGSVVVGTPALLTASTLGVYGTKAATYVLVDIGYVQTGNGFDSGAFRAAAVQASGSSDIRAGEFHVSRYAASSINGTWALELGVHSETAGDGSTQNVGIFLLSSHAGWTPTGVRNDTGILIGGADGWTHGIRYLDTNSTTVLFDIDQSGNMTLAGTLPAHGASVHDNRTRSIYLPASEWVLDQGTPDLATRGSAGALLRMPGWAMDPAADEAVATSIYMPADWTGGACTAYVYWAPSTTNTGNVYWAFLGAGVAVSQQIDQTQEFNLAPTQPAGDGTVDNLHIWTAGAFTPDNSFVRVNMARVATNIADTYTGDAYFLGVRIDYPSDM